MKRTVCAAVLGLFVSALMARADVTFNLIPADGSISGLPGDTIGWGYSVDNATANYLLVANTYFCEPGEDPMFTSCTQTLGSYMDYLAMSFQSNMTVIAPGETLSAFFDAGTMSGIGAYLIDAGALPGQVDIGSVVLVYDAFDANPYAGSADQIGGDMELAADASVHVGPLAAVPEPGSLLLTILAVLGLSFARIARMHRAQNS